MPRPSSAILAAACAVVCAAAYAEEAPAPTEAIQYSVDLQGTDDEDLRSDIEAASRLFTLSNEPPPGMIALRRRADEDRQRVDEVLRSRGYYDGKVDIRIDEQAVPVKVTVIVAPGQIYDLSSWAVMPDVHVSPDQVGLELGKPAVAADVVKAEGRLLELMAEASHPLAKVIRREAVVDYATHGMSVTEHVDPGPIAQFAAPDIEGLSHIDPQWVRDRVPWKPGDVFSPEKVEELRKSLASSGLFRTVRITSGKALDADGRLPVRVDLAERASRSVGAGVVYSTAEGPGAQAFWEDRNLFGRAERLRITGLASRPRYLALADYRAPDYFGQDKDLLGDLSYDLQRTTVYYTRTAALSAGIGWRISPIWSVSAAGALEHTIDEEPGQPRRDFDLASIPLSAKRDTTDDILDPTRGGRTTLTLRPFVELTGAHRQFTRVEVQQTGHFKLLDDPRTILALWADAGSYLNSKAIDLPADKRFYAGGGGSVRGYRLYYAGPLNSQGQPAGGRSLLGFGTELRIKVTDTVGIVPFFEGANVYQTPMPQLDQRMFYGTGLGLRYYTPIGPIRFDFAVPLHRRAGVDDKYEIYLSLGQAF